jgi:hypothetical protein
MMKFQGIYRVGCQCRYCVGPNGGNNPTKKAIKHGGRQDDRKEERESTRLVVKK